MAKELEVRRLPQNTDGRAERLAQIAAEESREPGVYVTVIELWVCSCPSFLLSRFLWCKHLIRETNKRLNNRPLTDLKFFLHLRRNHTAPYYSIPGIHSMPDTPADTPMGPILLLGTREGTQIMREFPTPAQPSVNETASASASATTAGNDVVREEEEKVTRRRDSGVDEDITGFDSDDEEERVRAQHFRFLTSLIFSPAGSDDRRPRAPSQTLPR